MSKIRGLAEVVLWVRDMEKAVHFYRDILGLEVFSPPSLKAVFLRAGQSTSSFPQQIVLVPLPVDAPALPTEKTRRNMHHFGVELAPEDFEKERDRLQSLGMPVRFGEHPFLPVRTLYVDDPDGNEVELAASVS